MLDIHSRPEIVRWFGTPLVMTDIEEARARIEKYRDYSPPLGSWAVEERDSGRVVGTVLLLPVRDRPQEVQVGWYLHPDSTGLGYATEAAAAVILHAAESGYSEVFAFTDVDNLLSHAVCRRLGMAGHSVTGLETERPTLVFKIACRGFGEQAPSVGRHA